MEKNSMTYPIIKDPEYIDLEKTRVKFKLINENGVISNAELTVPDGKARGINTFWDRIMDEFDIEQMRKARNDLENRKRQDEEFKNRKKQAAEENNKLKILFDAKMKAFELPYIAEASADIKSAIRRAPSVAFVDAIVNKQMIDYITEKNMTFLELLDHLDDLEEAKAAAEAQAREEAEAESTQQ